jgi:hypothetical protein
VPGSSRDLYFFPERRYSMSVYSVKGMGWRYDFTLKGIRFTDSGFKTKTEAKRAEATRKEEILTPKPIEETGTDMDFLELLNKRLDYIKAFNSMSHYREHVYYGKRWAKQWKQLKCGEITGIMIETYILKRSREVSNYTANKELRYIRALFNWGMKPERGFVSSNGHLTPRKITMPDRLLRLCPGDLKRGIKKSPGSSGIHTGAGKKVNGLKVLLRIENG